MNGVVKRDNIIIKDAFENNLKHINVEIPIDKFTCVTGVSGCGKSSLIYDTLYAESQRELLENLSGNMFAQKIMNKAHVGSIENLRPALNVSQNYYNSNPRSTIGTLSDSSHYLRTLFALITNYREGLTLKESFFSSNDPTSCCKKCKGLGKEYAVSMDRLIPDDEKTLRSGAISYFKGKETSEEYQTLVVLCSLHNIDLDKKVRELNDEEKEILLYRDSSELIQLKFKTPKGRTKHRSIEVKGAVRELEDKLRDIDTPSVFANISKYLTKQVCSRCQGTRLEDKVLEHSVCEENISNVENMPMNELNKWIEKVKHEYVQSNVHEQVNQMLNQIFIRTNNMIAMNIGYLSLNRSIPSLSGGEVQRVRICKQLNCALSGLVYILDEPCRGLHPRNIISIIDATKDLVAKGNTVIAIEHNRKYISEADKVIELGPVGGPKGGYVINEDVNQERKKTEIILNFKSPKSPKNWIRFEKTNFRNIVDPDVEIPLKKITCITGVSGSGKSTLVSVIEDCVSSGKAVKCHKFTNTTKVNTVDYVNQKPIGKTSRSTVASYLDVFDNIRQLFSLTESAKINGFTASDFSLNVPGGRCESCQGTGFQKIELNYLPDSYIECTECGGRRYHEDVLLVKYKDKTINDILNASVSELFEVFNDVIPVYSKLKCVDEIGLGYISLGQMSMQLSGGEAQRIKLAKSLGAPMKKKKIYILDEPTSGLNTQDIELLEKVLLKLEEQGETIIIIEHNIEFIAKISDYLLDFGIKSGDLGGKIVSKGLPENVFRDPQSSWYGLV